MPKSKTRSHTGIFTMDAETYTAFCDAAKELAFRGSTEEAVVLRLCKAGEINDVVHHITRLRLYAKKHRNDVEEDGDEIVTTPRRRTAPRRKKKQGETQRASDTPDTN